MKYFAWLSRIAYIHVNMNMASDQELPLLEK